MANKNYSKLVFFSPRRHGPEIEIEDAVLRGALNLISHHSHLWIGGSLPVGSARPDLTIVNQTSSIQAFEGLTPTHINILAYLADIAYARIDSITSITRQTASISAKMLEHLLSVGVVAQEDDKFVLQQSRLMTLPEVITVEAKVHKWRVALQQAARNQMLSTQSYVAIPQRLAERVSNDAVVQQFGIGILSIADDHSVEVIRYAKRTIPTIQRYYFQLVVVVAQTLGVNNAVHRTYTDCTKAVPSIQVR